MPYYTSEEQHQNPSAKPLALLFIRVLDADAVKELPVISGVHYHRRIRFRFCLCWTIAPAIDKGLDDTDLSAASWASPMHYDFVVS